MTSFLTRYRLSLLLTFIACVLWSLSLANPDLVINRYGLVSSYPVIFFIALALLTLAGALLWTSREPHPWLCILQILLLIVSLYLTPFIIEGTARFSAGYQNYGFVDDILRNQHLYPQGIWYHNWPGAWLFDTAIFQITGLKDPTIIMGVYNTVAQSLFLLPLFLIFRALRSDKMQYFWVFAWIFTLINWTNQEYFSAQSPAYLLMLFVIAVMLRNPEKQSPVFNVLALTLFISTIIVTHLITAIVTILVVVILYFVWRKKDYILLVLLLFCMGAWTLYGSYDQMQKSLPEFISQAFRLDLIYQFSFSQRFANSSPEHSFINNSRVLFTALFLLLGFLGFVLMRKEKHFSRSNLSMLAIVVPPIFLIPILVYSGEFIIRVFFFILVPIAFFTARLMERKYVMAGLLVVMIAAVPLHILTHYGNELLDRIPSSELAFTDYMYDNADSGYVLGNTPPITYQYLDKFRYYLISATSGDPDFSSCLEAVKNKQPEGTQAMYVSLSRRLDNMYSFYWGDNKSMPEFRTWIEDNLNYHLIYNNSDVDVYAWLP